MKYALVCKAAGLLLELLKLAVYVVLYFCSRVDGLVLYQSAD